MARNSPVSSWYKNNIKDYERYLGTILNRTSVLEHVNHLHRCAVVILEEYGETNVSDIDTDMLVRIAEIMNVSTQTTERRLSILGQFVQWMTGDNPFLEFRLKVHTQITGHDITRLYQAELDGYREILLQRSCTEPGIRSHLNSIRVCLRVIVDRFGYLSLFEIREEHIAYLVSNLGVRASTLDSYLSCIGGFLAYWIGENPVIRYKESVRSRKSEDRIRSTPFGDLILEYAEHLDKRGYRPATIKGRVYMLVNFFERGRRILGNLTLEQYDENAFVFMRSRIDDLSENTLRQYLQSAGMFIEWALGTNPYDNSRMMWNGAQIHRGFIFREEWDALMRVSDIADRMILMLGATLGMRRSEMLRLKLSDIEGDMITIHGKGHGPNGKVAVKRMSPRLMATLEEYMRHRANLISKFGDMSEGNLLVSETRHKVTPMTPCMLDRRIMRLSERSGVDFSSHMLRRYYATTLYDIGTDINTLRIMMRHEKVDTTMTCYLWADPRRIHSAEDGLDTAIFG